MGLFLEHETCRTALQRAYGGIDVLGDFDPKVYSFLSLFSVKIIESTSAKRSDRFVTHYHLSVPTRGSSPLTVATPWFLLDTHSKKLNEFGNSSDWRGTPPREIEESGFIRAKLVVIGRVGAAALISSDATNQAKLQKYAGIPEEGQLAILHVNDEIRDVFPKDRLLDLG